MGGKLLIIGITGRKQNLFCMKAWGSRILLTWWTNQCCDIQLGHCTMFFRSIVALHSFRLELCSVKYIVQCLTENHDCWWQGEGITKLMRKSEEWLELKSGSADWIQMCRCWEVTWQFFHPPPSDTIWYLTCSLTSSGDVVRWTSKVVQYNFIAKTRQSKQCQSLN